jgi:diguanylate cyclase (GGDEF)-like protein/PAS domain S-box-containing protein
VRIEGDATTSQLIGIGREELAGIAQTLPDLAFVAGPDGRLCWLSPPGRRMLGLEPNQPVSAYRLEQFLIAESMGCHAGVGALAAGGDGRQEATLRACDGTHIPVEVTYRWHEDEHGELACVAGIMADLRWRSQGLYASRERVAEAEMVAGLGSWEWNVTTGTVTWSPGMYRLHGMDAGDGAESVEQWLATVHPDDRERARHTAYDAAAAGTGLAFTYRGLHREGRELMIHGRGKMLTDDSGRSVRMVGTLQDVSEQHAAEAALRASQARARSILETASDAYIEHDANGRVTEWNRQAEITFGWSRTEALGRHLVSLIIPVSGKDRFVRGLVHYATTGEDPFAGVRREGTACDRHGRTFPVEFAAWLIEAADPPVFASFVRDITDRKQAQLELARQATTDALTGLANRAVLTDRLEHALTASAGSGEAVSLLLTDLDGFKSVNDAHGHTVGDAVLVETAQRWQESVRAGDTLARLGDDEFGLVLPDTDQQEAVRVARRLIDALAVAIEVEGVGELTLGASVGVAVSGVAPHGVGELRREADYALYAAKHRGRGQYKVCSATASVAAPGHVTANTGDGGA